MKLSKITIITSIIILLSGCVTTNPSINEPTILSTYGDLVSIPKAQPTNLKKIEWKIMNHTTLSQFLKTNINSPVMLYSLDDGNMQVMMGNMDDLSRYIKEQQAVITYLTGLIDLRRETVTKDNK